MKRFKTAVPYVLSLGLALLLGEAYLRIFWYEEFRLWDNEINTAYEFNDRLGWFPKKNIRMNQQGNQNYTVVHNSRGFRDHPHQAKSKKRMLFLGDSFVYGYDVAQNERFTDLLAKALPEWEVLNLGVSGYGTVQQLLLIRDYFDVYRPDVVFHLFQYDNDPANNASNIEYGDYYRPYYVLEQGWLNLKGVPVPKGIRYYQREYPVLFRIYMVRALFKAYMQLKHPEIRVEPPPTNELLLATKKFVEEKGARYLLGFTQYGPNGNELAFCHKHQIDCVELSSDLRYPDFGQHWTPAGHREVFKKLFHFLREIGIDGKSSD